MNIKEIYVLNTALDGKQILYLPDFDQLHMSGLLVDDIKELLIEKGLLESANSLTMEGAKIVKRMEDFKKAKKYIKLGSLLIGIKNENEGVLLKYIPRKEEYFFERINLTNSVSNLMESYPFLKESFSIPESAESEILTFEQARNRFNPGIDDCIYMSTMDLNGAKNMGDVKITNEMIFAFQGNLYLYNRETELLFKKGNEEILALIEERMKA